MRKAPRFLSIVLAIIVATMVLTMVFVPAAMAEGETLAVDTVVKIIGPGYRFLGCWTVREKRPWTWNDYKFFQDYCQEAVGFYGQTGVVEGTVGRFWYVKVGDYRYWFSRGSLQKVSAMILKDPPVTRYLPECGVPIVTPTPEKQVIPTKTLCRETYVVQWGDSLSAIALDKRTTVVGITMLNDFSDINVIYAGTTICVR